MTHIPRAFCAHCDQEMFCDEIGKVVEAMTQSRPYYKVNTDKYTCRGCGASVLLYSPDTTPVHHHDARYNDFAADYRVTFLKP